MEARSKLLLAVAGALAVRWWEARAAAARGCAVKGAALDRFASTVFEVAGASCAVCPPPAPCNCPPAPTCPPDVPCACDPIPPPPPQPLPPPVVYKPPPVYVPPPSPPVYVPPPVPPPAPAPLPPPTFTRPSVVDCKWLEAQALTCNAYPPPFHNPATRQLFAETYGMRVKPYLGGKCGRWPDGRPVWTCDPQSQCCGNAVNPETGLCDNQCET